MQVTALVQNVAGGALGTHRRGGGLAFTRINVNLCNPDFVILMETRIADSKAYLDNVFRGFKCLQHSSSGDRSKGVMIFSQKKA